MCGLFGTITLDTPDIMRTKILGLYNVERGTNSCGLYIDGYIAKGTHKTANFKDFIAKTILDDLESDCKMIIGHTRASTHGASIVKNAHPFEIFESKMDTDPYLIGAHNGIIHNWMELCHEKNINLTSIDVDSEGFYTYFAKFPKDKWNIPLSEYTGYAALSFTLAKEENQTLYLFKGASMNERNVLIEERPLYGYFTKDKRTFFYSSIADSLYAIGADGETIIDLASNVLYSFVANPNNKTLVLKLRQIKRKKPYYTRNSAYTTGTSTNTPTLFTTNNNLNNYPNLNSNLKLNYKEAASNFCMHSVNLEDFLKKSTKYAINDLITEQFGIDNSNSIVPNLYEKDLTFITLQNSTKQNLIRNIEDIKQNSPIRLIAPFVTRQTNRPSYYNYFTCTLAGENNINIIKNVIGYHKNIDLSREIIKENTPPKGDYTTKSSEIIFENGIYRRNGHVLHDTSLYINTETQRVLELEYAKKDPKYSNSINKLIEEGNGVIAHFLEGVFYPGLDKKNVVADRISRRYKPNTIFSKSNPLYTRTIEGLSGNIHILTASANIETTNKVKFFRGNTPAEGLVYYIPLFSDRLYVMYEGVVMGIYDFDIDKGYIQLGTSEHNEYIVNAKLKKLKLDFNVKSEDNLDYENNNSSISTLIGNKKVDLDEIEEAEIIEEDFFPLLLRDTFNDRYVKEIPENIEEELEVLGADLTEQENLEMDLQIFMLKIQKMIENFRDDVIVEYNIELSEKLESKAIEFSSLTSEEKRNNIKYIYNLYKYHAPAEILESFDMTQDEFFEVVENFSVIEDIWVILNDKLLTLQEKYIKNDQIK